MGNVQIGKVDSWAIEYLNSKENVNSNTQISGVGGNSGISSCAGSGSQVDSRNLNARSAEESSCSVWESIKTFFAELGLSCLAKINPQKLLDGISNKCGDCVSLNEVDYNTLSPKLQSIVNKALSKLAGSDPKEALTRIGNKLGNGFGNIPSKIKYNTLPSEWKLIVNEALSNLAKNDPEELFSEINNRFKNRSGKVDYDTLPSDLQLIVNETLSSLAETEPKTVLTEIHFNFEYGSSVTGTRYNKFPDKVKEIYTKALSNLVKEEPKIVKTYIGNDVGYDKVPPELQDIYNEAKASTSRITEDFKSKVPDSVDRRFGDYLNSSFL